MTLARYVAAAAACLALAGGQSRAADVPPWSERVLVEHIDFDAWAGNLDAARMNALAALGLKLFTAKFTLADGAGRPLSTQAIVPTNRKRPVADLFSRTAGMDANACSSCHNDPAPGGAGDFTQNVFVSEGFDTPDFDSLDPQFSNERGTKAMNGSGLVELLAREMTADLQAERKTALHVARATGAPVKASLQSKGVAFGTLTANPDGTVGLAELDGVDTDLVIRPFSQKGVFNSIRQFTINALNQHHGMQATERFGKRWTGTDDFDGDGMKDEISEGDVSALVAFQATMTMPSVRADLSPDWKTAAAAGEATFTKIGCAECHRPALPLKSLSFSDPGPIDAAGTLRNGEVKQGIAFDLGQTDWGKSLKRDADGNVLVPLFGDLKRHVVVDAQVASLGNELIGQRFVERDVFMTAELWGVASTAPYGHRGDKTSMDEVIRAHGGEARQARDAYVDGSEADRQSIIAFLKTLVIAK